MPDIDERVVQMKFDNGVFEKKIRQTISSLGQLEEKMNFRRSKSGLDDLERVAKKVELTPLEASVEKLTKKFSTMGIISRTVIANITTDAYKCGKKLNKLFSDIAIQPMKDGFAEYETQMGAIQTILANTKSKGSTMDDVTAALDELNTYADKTIYNFTEMTRNIGTFTAAGVGLEASTQAIKGIANLAAVSGSTSNQASVAMYQLSQALASGTVKLMDWNSVVNAGMGGEVFQNALKRTAKNMGFAVDEIIEKAGSFRESLSDGWLTSDVLTETLAQIAGAYDKATLRSKGYTDEQIAEILDLARTAEDAATKVKTWTQLVDTLKEALGSGWAKSWELIFGNFEQAQETFTSISNVLGGIIDRVSTARNTLLTKWGDLGGRTDLITGIINLFWDLVSVVEVVRRAWSQVFPPVTAEMLAKITKGFRELTIDLAMDQATVDSLTSVFNALFSILKLGIHTVSELLKALKPVGAVILKIVKYVILILGYISKSITKLTSLVNVSKIITSALGGIKTALYGLVTVLVLTTASIVNFISSLREIPVVKNVIDGLTFAFQTLYTYGSQKLSGVIAVVSNLINSFRSGTIVTTVLNGVGVAISYVCNGLTTLKDLGATAFQTVVDGVRRIPEILSNVATTVMELFASLGDKDSSTDGFTVSMMSTVPTMKKAGFEFNNLKDTIVTFVKVVHDKLASLDVKQLLALGLGASLVLLVVSLSKLATSATIAIDSIVTEFKTFNKTVTSFLNTLKTTFTTIVTTLNNFGNKLKSSVMVQLVLSLVALAGAVIMLAQIPIEELIPAVMVMVALSEAFVRLVTITSTLGPTSNALALNAKLLLAVAASAVLAVQAISVLNNIEVKDGIGDKFLILTALITEVVAFAAILGTYVPKLSKGGLFLTTFTASIWVMVKALGSLSEIDINQFKENASVFAKAAAILGGLVAVMSLFTLELKSKSTRDDGEVSDSVLALGKRMNKIAFAIGGLVVDMMLFIGAFKILSKVQDIFTPELVEKASVIAGLMTRALLGLSLLSSELTFGGFNFKLGKNVLKLTLSVGMIAVDILAFAGALNILTSVSDSITPESVANIIKLGTIVGVATLALTVFSGSFKFGKVGEFDLGKRALRLVTSLVVICGAIALLARVVKTLSLDYVSWDAGIDVLQKLSILVAGLMAITGVISNKAKVAPILAIVTAIGAIMTSLLILQMYDTDDILKGGFALAASLVGVGMALTGLSSINEGKISKQVITIIEIIAMIGSATVALYILAKLPWQGLLVAVGSLAGIMLSMAAATNIANNSHDSAKSMLLMIPSIVASAFSLSLIASLPWESILAAGGSLSAVMIAAAFAAKLANESLVGAFAMIPLAASVFILAAAFKSLETVNFEALLPNLIALGVSIGVLAILGAIAGKIPVVAVGMIAVAAAFWIFAKGVEAFGAGANLLASGVEKVVSALERLGNIDAGKVANIQNVIVTTLVSLGTGIGQGVAAIITNIATSVSTGIIVIATAVSYGISMISTSISDGITNISTTACGLLFSFAGDAASALVSGVKSVASNLFETGKNFITNFINGIREKAGWNSPPQIIMDFINDASDALEMGVVYNEDGTVNAGHKFAAFFNSGLLSDDFTATGKEWCGGIIDGIMGMLPDIKLGGENTFMAFVDGILNARKNAELKISKVAATSALELQIRGEYDPRKGDKAALLGEFGGADADAIAKSDIHSLLYKITGDVKSSAGDVLSGMLPEELSGLTDDISDGISGLTNSIGGSAAASTNDAEAKQLQAKYISYVTSVAWKYAETFDSIDAAMGKSTGIESAREAVERFARAMADANSVDSTTGIEEYKKQFVDLYESVVSAVDGVDKFTKISRTMSKTAPKTYINNLKTNSKAITEWGNALQTLARKGFSTNIIRKIIDNGVSDVTMFNDFLRASSAEVEAINNSYVDIQNQSFVAADYAMSAMTRAAEMAAERQRMMQEEAASAQTSADIITNANNKIAENADKTSNKVATTTEFVPQLYSTMVQSIEDTVSSQVSIFDAFSKDFDTTKEDILSNMASQVAGMYEYQDMILQLNETKISDDLLQYLISLGQDGWGYIREFTRMSEDELRNANNYYQQMQELPQTCAVKIADGLSDIRSAFNVPIDQATTAGADLAQGFANGIDTTAANDKATTLGDNSIDALKTALDTHSPSRKTFDEGENFDLGLAQGIESKKNLVVEAVQDLGEAMLEAIREVLDMHSPSRKLFNVGELSDQGLANGLINGIHVVATAAKSVGQSVFDNAKNGLQSYMNLDFDREITPRITPVYSFAGMGGMTTPVRIGNRDNYVSAMASSINDIRNGKGPHYTTVNVDNSEVVTAINDLRRDIDGLKDSMSHMQVVMDTGATVGALAPGIDRELGKKSTFTKRGN